MHHLVDANIDVLVTVLCLELRPQHGVIQSLFDKEHLSATILDVVEHIGIGNDVVNALPIVVEKLVM